MRAAPPPFLFSRHTYAVGAFEIADEEAAIRGRDAQRLADVLLQLRRSRGGGGGGRGRGRGGVHGCCGSGGCCADDGCGRTGIDGAEQSDAKTWGRGVGGVPHTEPHAQLPVLSPERVVLHPQAIADVSCSEGRVATDGFCPSNGGASTHTTPHQQPAHRISRPVRSRSRTEPTVAAVPIAAGLHGLRSHERRQQQQHRMIAADGDGQRQRTVHSPVRLTHSRLASFCMCQRRGMRRGWARLWLLAAGPD